MDSSPSTAALIVSCLENEGVTHVFGIQMDLEIGRSVDTAFGNPDFVAYAESFGAAVYRITAAADLLPTLRTTLAADTVPVIACPVDYSANLELIGGRT
jgi:thiamine pyrophosphate-dependent acetolactate synthase large subunit-like protein